MIYSGNPANMTSNTSPSPFVASGSSSAGYTNYWNAFDGNSSTGFKFSSSSDYVQLSFGQKLALLNVEADWVNGSSTYDYPISMFFINDGSIVYNSNSNDYILLTSAIFCDSIMVKMNGYLNPPNDYINITVNSYMTLNNVSSVVLEENNMSAYINYINTQTIREPIYKIELLRKIDETPYLSFEGELIDSNGTLTIGNEEGVRRTCSFSISNINNEYTELFKNIGIGSKFKLYLGYRINGNNFYMPQGIFIIDTPQMNSLLADKSIIITGTDKWSMLNGSNGGVLQVTYSAAAGSKLGDMISTLLSLDIVSDPKPPIIDSSVKDFEIYYDIVKPVGNYVSDIILEAVYSASCYCYYDESGFLNVRPFEYDFDKYPAHFFSDELDINYISSQRIYNLVENYNAIYVEGDNTQSEDPVYCAFAYNQDPTDPNSIPSLGYRKFKIITEYTKGINTQEKANDRAMWELKKASSEQSNVTINSVPMYHLDVNKIIALTDSHLGADGEKFLINSISIPISISGEMTLEVVKAKEKYI